MPSLKSINPSNYGVIAEVETTPLADIDKIIAEARGAQHSWRELGLEGRIELLEKAVLEIVENKQEFAEIQSKEMGMPINDALMDVDDGANFSKWYFQNAEKYLAPEVTVDSETERHIVYREPIGVVAVVIPWNFPWGNFVWGAMQNLIVGNTIVLKHSEECPLSAKFIADIFQKHLPSGVFGHVIGGREEGDKLTDGDIDMICFTGSTKTGKYLYKKAGERFIKAVMELGGSAPGIVFADADIEKSLESACTYRLFNAGQCCDGLKRLIVHESIAEEVIEKLRERFGNLKVGVALHPSTEIGPLVAKRQLDLLESQVEDAISQEAEVVVGGKSLEDELGGAFYMPTVLKNVTADMRVMTEEVFGPVLPVVTFKTDEEALKIANKTSYGLGAYLYTSSEERIKKLTPLLSSGMVSVNGVTYINPNNPFGGYKSSGMGREHGKYGFHELTQLKVVAEPKS